MAKTLQFRRGTTSELALITPAAGEILIDTTLNTIKIGNDTVEGGKIINGLSGSSYIYVTGNGTDTANGEELAAAYALAKTMTPYGSSLQDPDNRVKVIIAPGKYYVGGGTAFPNNRWDIDAHCVDIVSLTGNRDVWIIGNINIAGGDLGSVIVSGLDVSDYIIFVGNNLEFLTMENCKASSLAHGDIDDMPISLSGTFIDCESTYEGFANIAGSDASGTFINCKTGSGFGGTDCNATGVFTNCTAMNGFTYSQSNTGYGIASGTFTNCVSEYEGFGGGEGGVASGVFTNCVGGNGSFAGWMSAPNTFLGTITGTLNYCRLTNSGEFAPTSGSGKLHYCIDGNGKEVTSGGGLGGTSYVFVAGDQSTALLNGQQLINAYALAKTMTPFGNSLSSGNRVRVVVAPGFYEIVSNFTIDADYVDIVSLTGNRDVLLYTSNDSTFNVTASTYGDVYIKGLDLATYYMTFGIADNLYYSVFENCSGSEYSFGGNNSTVAGTFINCKAENYSFGGTASTVNGTFINCNATGNQNFGGNYSSSSGTFTNCTSGGYSFGGLGSSPGGTYNNCYNYGSNAFGGASDSGFEYVTNVTGTFNNCTSGDNSFGGNGDIGYITDVTGTFNSCTATGPYSFGGDYSTVSGTFTNCKAFSDCFGAENSTVSGIFTNCSSQYSNSFGGDGSTVSGIFTNCDGGQEGASFGGGSTGTFSGIANNCTAAIFSFGQGGLTGKLYFCRLTSGTYPTPGVGGKIRFCLDGNDNPEDISQYLP
jgi:hypothetical protein